MALGRHGSMPIQERLILLLALSLCSLVRISSVPCVAVGTWHFSSLALEHAKGVLEAGGSALDAAERGINALELDTSEQTFVGYGGLPNAEGHMELDAAIMDGEHGPVSHKKNSWCFDVTMRACMHACHTYVGTYICR
jgi:hypothetical protein